MRLASKLIILLWVLVPISALGDVWLIGESLGTRLFLCFLEMSMLTAGYLFGKLEYSKKK